MKLLNFICLLSIVSCTNAQSDPIAKALHERAPNGYTFSTKLGVLKFLDADGKLGSSAKSITLNDKTLIDIKNENDAQGSALSLMEEDLQFSSTE